MAVKLKPHSLPALMLALALPVAPDAVAQTSYVGGGSVIVNMQALDRLGPPLPGFLNNSSPDQPLYGGAAKPLIGDSGGQTGTVKLRPPRAARASTTPAATPAVANAPTPAASDSTAAPRRSSGKKGEGTSAAPQTPAVVVNLPPPVVAAAPAQSAAPAPAPAAQPGRPLQLPTPPSATAPAPAPLTPVPAPAPAAVAPAAVAPAAVAAAPAPAAPAAPAPVARPSNPASQQTALLTPPSPASAAPSGTQVNLSFEPGKSDLAGEGTGALEALARSLANTEDRIQIRAYASASGADAASGARRLSLSRALAVRGFLIDRGIRSTRIDVRALGAPTDNSPADRVEVVPVGR